LRTAPRRITLVAEVTMAQSKKQVDGEGTRARSKGAGRGESRVVKDLAERVRQAVSARVGPNATFEQRRDAAAQLMSEVLWKDADRDLQDAVTDAEEVDVDDQRYVRLKQRSSATYFGRWGPHKVEEALYRRAGVRNGPTVKPIELRVGIIEHMTPDMARVVGELFADRSSRQVERTMKTVGIEPPSRSFLEKRGKQMAGGLTACVGDVESKAQVAATPPAEVAAVACGMDRMAVRMAEPLEPSSPPPPPPYRPRPYERTPPEPRQHNYRMAWVGSTTLYDRRGEPLLIYRYAADAASEPEQIAKRISADVAWAAAGAPEVAIHCVQDGAKELRVLPETLRRQLPANTVVRELVDFEHVAGYLDAVVDATQPAGDPHDWKAWYRYELLRDDRAIDRIWRKLRELGRRLPRENGAARTAVAEALSYIRKRKPKMRYATHYAKNLPIGSGVTENTCWTMQDRVKRPGQSWETAGLRAILVLRSLVESDRWTHAWPAFAATHRRDVRAA
jgi:hypothetical protein